MINRAVLAYHSVNTAYISPDLTVLKKDFEWQLGFLKDKGFSFLSPVDFFKEDNNKKALITFDDGFSDIDKFALPFLLKENIPFIVFFSPYEVLNSLSVADMPLLSLSRIKELASLNGAFFGSHAYKHIRLKELSFEDIKENLFLAKKEAENITGKECLYFCPPYGSVNSDVIKAARLYYNKLFISLTKEDMFLKHDNFVVPRAPVYGATGKLKFFLKLSKSAGFLRRIYYGKIK